VTDHLMRTARLHAAGDIRVHDEPVPALVDGEELVKVTAVGICGSDLHWFSEGAIGDTALNSPLVLGHEMGGTIVSGPRAGQRVAIDPAVPCWRCEECRAGKPNLCPNVRFAGHGSTDGGLRQYLTWPADRLHPVPDSLTDSEVALLEPLGVALHAVDLGHLRLGAVAAVVGCGPIGLLTLQLLHLAGATRVIAIEPLKHRRDAAEKLGATVLDGPSTLGALADSVDVVVETAGNDDAVDYSIMLCRPGGRVVLAGIPDGDHTSFVASSARRKGLTFAMSRRMAEVYPRTVALLAARRVDTSGLLREYRGLDTAARAFSDAHNRVAHKIILIP
jgi:L-iditol 2-dehydrogenase